MIRLPEMRETKSQALALNSPSLPEEIINKIMLYNSHPISDIFKQSDYYIFFHKFRETDEFSKFVFIFIEYLRIEKKRERMG